MRSLLLRSRSLCLPAGMSCRGGESTFRFQHQQDTVRVVRVDTLQLLHFPETLTVAQLLEQLNVPHHCVFQVHTSTVPSPSASGDLSSDTPAGSNNLVKGPLLALDTELEIGCVYFLKPLPTLLYKLRNSRRAAASLLSDNPFTDSTRHSCCCAARHGWGTPGTSPPRPCFATSLSPDTSGRQSPAVAPSLSRSPSLKRTPWSALAGRVAFLNLGDQSKSAKKRLDLEALELVEQATMLSEEDSAISETPKSPDPCTVAKAVRAITSGWYAPSQCMRNTWKPELRGICERSASARPAPQVYRESLESCIAERRRDDLSEEAVPRLTRGVNSVAGKLLRQNSAPAATRASPSDCRTASTKSARKQRSSWDLRSLAGFGGFGGTLSVPEQWR